MSGSAGQQRVPKEHFADSPLPLPPLAEQRRIVEKVDQLLGLCDELAARQAAQREKRQRLVGATLEHHRRHCSEIFDSSEPQLSCHREIKSSGVIVVTFIVKGPSEWEIRRITDGTRSGTQSDAISFD